MDMKGQISSVLFGSKHRFFWGQKYALYIQELRRILKKWG